MGRQTLMALTRADHTALALSIDAMGDDIVFVEPNVTGPLLTLIDPARAGDDESPFLRMLITRKDFLAHIQLGEFRQRGIEYIVDTLNSPVVELDYATPINGNLRVGRLYAETRYKRNVPVDVVSSFGRFFDRLNAYAKMQLKPWDSDGIRVYCGPQAHKLISSGACEVEIK